MKDGTARALAIVALVFMVVFIAAFIAALVDNTLFNGSIGYITVGLGVFIMMIFIALRADGRGFSVTEINNEIEMKKIEDELAAREKTEAENSDADKTPDGADPDGEKAGKPEDPPLAESDGNDP